MTPWLEEYYNLLESKREAISHSDFRYHNIGRMPLLALKTEELSSECQDCKINMDSLVCLGNMLPDCFADNQQLKEFAERKNKIENHLKIKHHLRPAHYFAALYTLLGVLAGVAVGLITSYFFINNIQFDIIIICAISGLIMGRLFGNRADKKYYREQRQI